MESEAREKERFKERKIQRRKKEGKEERKEKKIVRRGMHFNFCSFTFVPKIGQQKFGSSFQNFF